MLYSEEKKYGNVHPYQIQMFSSSKSHVNNFELKCNGPKQKVYVELGECMYSQEEREHFKKYVQLIRGLSKYYQNYLCI